MNDVESAGDVASGGHGGSRSNAFLCSKFERSTVGARADDPAAADPRSARSFHPTHGAFGTARHRSAVVRAAKAALDSHQIAARDTSASSTSPRRRTSSASIVVDLRSGLADSFRVAHGRGSDPDHSGFVERFSNDFGSHATSNGTYTTADYYQGKYGLSMKVRGLDWSNYNAEPRAIVIHNAWYAEDEMIGIHGKLGRSEGCFAFSRADQWSVMRKLAGGRMIYADKLA